MAEWKTKVELPFYENKLAISTIGQNISHNGFIFEKNEKIREKGKLW